MLISIFLKRGDNGKALLKIMRNFDHSKGFTSKCCEAIKNPSYPVQLIWGIDDPFLTYEQHGIQFEKARKLHDICKLEAKHFLQEEKWKLIANKVSLLVNLST